MSINIKLFECGRTRVHTSMWTQPADRSIYLRKLHTAMGREWTDWTPVYAYLIEHPEGNIMVDLGLSPQCVNSDYFPLWSASRYLTVFNMEESEGIGAQLRKQNIDPTTLKAVVVSHMHFDHGGGLSDVGDVPVFISKDHWHHWLKHGVKSTFEGAIPYHYLESFKPRFLVPSGPAVGPWEYSYPLTDDGKVVAVDTPGHTPGHVSVIVFADDVAYFITGDATYTLEHLDKEQTDGVNDDPLVAVESVRKIKEFCRQRKVVVLPSHDTAAPRRLAEKIVYQPSPSA